MTQEKEIIDYEKGLTFEKVWASIQKLGDKIEGLTDKYDAIFEREAKERQEREAKEREERRKADEERRKADEERRKADEERRIELKEATKKATESIDRAARLVASLSKEFRNLGNRFGDLVEHLIAPGIAEQFRQIGYFFEDAVPPFGLKFYEAGNVIAQADVVLENDTTIAIIEIKANPNTADVKDHLKRMKILRQYYDQQPDKANKKLIGAIAGAIFHREAKDMATEIGFYIFTQSGDTIKLNVPENFKPRLF
ncbi:MAG: hypothetical protein LBI18_00160 [Planctomycetaceae bacterium]|jgi:hypothetical protein|nr:hypothetical protein [Planctomycetaceae bacterium]